MMDKVTVSKTLDANAIFTWLMPKIISLCTITMKASNHSSQQAEQEETQDNFKRDKVISPF
jgi:hypothetical protein